MDAKAEWSHASSEGRVRALPAVIMQQQRGCMRDPSQGPILCKVHRGDVFIAIICDLRSAGELREDHPSQGARAKNTEL